MAIEYLMKPEGDLLCVEASGFDESLAEVQEYGLAVLTHCAEGQHKRLLCDERRLEYRLDTVDTFRAAAFISEIAPGVGRAALVCHPSCAKDAQFWETVAVNRGVAVRVFQDLDAACAWLGVPPRS